MRGAAEKDEHPDRRIVESKVLTNQDICVAVRTKVGEVIFTRVGFCAKSTVGHS